MTLTKPTYEQLLADIRMRLKRGELEATAERVKQIATRESDPDLLRQLMDVLSDAVTNPVRRKAGNPRKSLKLPRGGVIDLDAMPALTAREQSTAIRTMVREFGVCEKIYKAHKNHGANLKAECQRYRIGTSTYYKWFPAGS